MLAKGHILIRCEEYDQNTYDPVWITVNNNILYIQKLTTDNGVNFAYYNHKKYTRSLIY